MSDMPEHAKPPARRDHLWVLFIIAACALIEVWASWIAIGSMSGFPKIGGAHGLSTDWTLAVTTEAYWGYALYSWLAAAPGPRSRKFAMWSAIAVFILSLTGQGAAHLVKPGALPAPALVVFVTALPVLVLALIAILVHLRQEDREAIEADVRAAADAERQAAIERAEADDRTALRAELSSLQTELDGARTDLGTARREAETATARAETLARKLASASGPAKGGSGRRKPLAGTARKAPVPARPEVPAADPDDLPGNWGELDTEARVLALVDEKGYSASKAGITAGVSDARGRQIVRMARDLTATAPQEALGPEPGTS